MDYDESSDILGGRIHVSPPRSSVWSDPGQITLLLGLGMAALYAWVRVAPHYRQWRETRYRKAMRRRHGIPDDDNRPFNVAYAAALQARKGKDGRGKVSLEDEASVPSHGGEDERLAGGVPQHLPPPSYVSGGYANLYPVLNHEQAVLHPDAMPVQAVAQSSSPFAPSGSLERKSRADGVKGPLVTRSSHGKHALDDEIDPEPETQAKKTRLEGERPIDGDADADWHGQNEDMDVDEVQPAKRGSKRVASLDDESFALSRAERLDKRARKVSLERSPQSADEDMEDEEDLEYVIRGKKRDRTEAESTFGGDDSVMDDDEKPLRRRQRRNVSNKLVPDLSRGQKRGRDSHSHDSDDSDSEVPRRGTTRKKRGRRSHDEMMPLSNDPLCKGRRIGEEWESNGIRFKVGPNGQRLRQELVKKSRSRFPMPSDSQHPDRGAHVDVYVEVWLSEEEYRSAKERHELAWQDASPTPPEPQTPGDILDSPSKAGKNLLWLSSMSSRESPSKRGPFRQSVVTNAALRLNVFPPAPAPSNRRISSVYQAPSSPAADSPKLQKSKSYSKWEKQDLEAAAMSKIRARQQAEGFAEANKAVPSAPSARIPFNTTSGPTTSKVPEKQTAATAPSFGFVPSAGSNNASKATASEAPKFNVPTTTPAPASSEPTKPAAPSFSFAPSSTSTATPATAQTASAAQPAAPQAGSSVPNFFAKPATQSSTSSATPSTTPSTSVPNFFAPKAPAASAAPAASGTAASTAASSSETSKSTFSFGTNAPAQPAGSAAPSIFGNATNSSDAAKSDQNKPAPGTSLLSRLGMGPPPSQPAATSNSTPTFSFAKPDAAAASAPAAGSEAHKTGAATSSSGPKFSFGVTSKPSSAAPTPAPTANGASASTAPAAPTPTFSFGAGSSSQPAASNTSSPFGAAAGKDAAGSSAPKSAFAFGGSTPASSAFGGGNAASSTPAVSSPFGGASNNAAKSAEAPKSAFGFGGSTSGTTASPFGAASSFSPFGAPASSSGDAAKPAEAPKSAFSFGAGNTTSSSSTPSFFGGGANNAQKTDAKADGQASKPTFSFGTSSSTPAFGASSAPSGASAFGASSTTNGASAFGSSSKPATTSAFGTTSTPSTSAFGASTNPAPTSAFGASSTPTSAFGSSSTPAFGATTTPGAPASGSKPTFSFGFGASNAGGASSTTPAATNTTENKPAATFSFGASNNASTPAFGSQPANGANGSAPSPFGAPSSTTSGGGAFSFGAPSGAFSFGSNQNAQK